MKETLWRLALEGEALIPGPGQAAIYHALAAQGWVAPTLHRSGAVAYLITDSGRSLLRTDLEKAHVQHRIEF